MAEAPHNVVLLRHTLPDGSSHIDLFIDDLPTSDAGLLSIQLSTDPRRLHGDQRLVGRLIGRHRRHYLNYQGPLDPDPDGQARGDVCRIAMGRLIDQKEGPHQTHLTIQWISPDAFTQALCLQEHGQEEVEITLEGC